MNQKSTKRSRQRLQSYLLLTVMAVLSLLGNNSFAQTACSCTSSSSNLLTNGSFESSGTGWSVSGGSLTFGSTYAVCGSKNAYLNFNCGTAKVWQKVTAAAGGKTVTFKAWAGTHTRGISCSPRLTMYFYSSSNTLLSSASAVVDKDVDKPDYKLKEYTVTAVAPSNTYYVKVEGSIGCNTLKLDAMCLTIANAPSLGCIGDKVWSDANCNGIQDSGEPGICGVTVQLKNASGVVIATTTTNSSGAYKFSGLAAGNYTVVFPAALSGSVLTSSIVGSNRDVDSDPNQSTGATAVIALAAGQTITNVDAGYCANVMSLGNRVWYDANCNGINDNANEPGLANVTLKLYKDNNNDNVADGAAIATTTTDANGYYMFKNLIPGNYIVGVVTPAGYTSSSVNGGDPDNNINLDDNGQVTVGNETRGLAITLTAGAEPNGSCGTSNSNITYDFGFCKTVPPPTTCDCTNSTANLLTNASFENGSTGWSVSGGSLTTGTGYVVCGYKNAFLNQSSGTAKVWQQVTTIAAGSTVVFKGFAGTHTAGIRCSPKLTLAFYNSSNVLISSSSVTVDKNVDVPDYKLKEYTIAALAPAGTYYTRVEGSIGCNVLKLDALCLTATPPVLGCLGDKVWADLNTDGIQDADEPGIAGVTVTLTYPNNTTATTTTNANGIYSFCSLAAGTYKVTFGNPGGQYVPTVSNAGSDETKDSDPVGGVVAGINLEPGETNLTIDAGFILKNLCLGNFVWSDQNVNGKQDAGEVGVAGVSVNLYADSDGDNAADGAAIATTTTNAGGLYSFCSLAPGKYIVGVVIPAGYDATVTTASSTTPDNDDNTDNNGVVTTSGELFSNFITLSNAGEPTGDGDGNNGNLTLDFGLIGEASLGDFVWYDINANGIQDAGEPGIENVTVQLFTCADVLVATTTTNSTGIYGFSNLTPGSYYVVFTAPAGYSISAAGQGGDGTKDSDANTVTGKTSCVTLASGENNITIDAGLYQSASLGDFVWFDKNANGIQDAGEPGVGNVTVQLFTCADVLVATTTTNSNGIYGFSNLTPGSYYVVFTAPAGYAIAASGQGGDAAKDSDANPATGKTSCVTLVSGENNITIDAGLIGSGSLGDFVWHDLNADGIQDAGEPGKPDVKVTITYPDATTASVLTDADGKYLFSNLAPGTYSVAFELPSGFFASPSNQGADDAKDSDPVGGVVSGIVLGFGENNLTIDAGFYCKLLNLGNFVWSDLNKNGVQDAGEPGVSGASVNLYTDINGDNLADGPAVATTTTDANGVYGFTPLAPGKYIVGVVIPAGYTVTATTATSAAPDNDDNTDNNGVSTVAGELFSNAVTLTTYGEPSTDGDGNLGNLTLDFGLYQPASLGDFVWMDGNANGIQEPGETGIPNVTVTLYTCADALVATTTTNGTGYYSFSGLAAGSYYVLFNAPSGYFFSPSNKGTDITIDSDPNVSTFKSSCVTLAAGDNNNTIDAGLYQKVSLGNFVWSDKNNNGIQDGGLEIGFTGLRVYLYKDADGDNLPDGASVATAVTLPNGLYSFTGLTPGKYIVGLVVPAGYLPGATIASSFNPDNDINTDNNGVRVSGGQFYSNSITLTSNGEPTNDGDDNNGNTTLDFGLACGCPSARGISSTTNASGGKQPGEIIAYKGFNVTGVYPNPFVDRVSIGYTSESVEKVSIRIMDNTGRTVYNTQSTVQAGKNNIQLSDLNRLSAGSYIVEIRTSTAVYNQKLVK